MYKAFYEGVLDDSPDDDGYSKWSDTCSQEYDWYSDACSDTYDFYSDTSSDIYDFYSDVGSAIYKDDMSKAQKRIDKFEAKIEKLKTISNCFYIKNTICELNNRLYAILYSLLFCVGIKI